MEEAPHKCPVCNRTFNQRANLKTHMQQVHTSEHQQQQQNTTTSTTDPILDLSQKSSTPSPHKIHTNQTANIINKKRGFTIDEIMRR